MDLSLIFFFDWFFLLIRIFLNDFSLENANNGIPDGINAPINKHWSDFFAKIVQSLNGSPLNFLILILSH
jgi:hypothetical protein